MDEAVVNRVKLAWGAAGLGVTALVLVGWGAAAAAVAAAAFVGVSVLAFVAFFLYLLMGDAPVVWRLLVIAVVLVGVIVELGAMATVLGWLLRGDAG